MIDWYLTCNPVMPLQSFCLPLLDVGIDSLQAHFEIHLQKYSVRLVVFCLEVCRPEILHHIGLKQPFTSTLKDTSDQYNYSHTCSKKSPFISTHGQRSIYLP